MKNCYRCGGPAEITIDDGDSAICDTCERDYQAYLAETWPFGQCQTCGAVYRQDICERGVAHVSAPHVEGACGAWDDIEPPSAIAAALGACYYGCLPGPTAWFSYFAASDAADMLAAERDAAEQAAEYARLKAHDDEYATYMAREAEGMYRSYMQGLSDRLDEMSTRGRYGRPDFTPDFGGIAIRRAEEAYANRHELDNEDLPF